MKKHFLLLLIIPICFLIFSIQLKYSDGPNYNYAIADPSYAYLINSLSLAQGEGVFHVDHPGTTLQLAGSVVIKIFYALTHEKNDIAEDVLYRPESYLRAIDFTLIFLNSLGLYLMGLIIYSVKKNIFVCMLFQLIPFISINILVVFSLVKTENFSFFIIAILISLFIKFTYKKDITEKDKSAYAIVFGILCGMILATKISFLCLFLIPLIVIPGVRGKLIFVSVTLVSFFIFVLPAISNAGYFINWISNMIFHDGRYGQGNANFLNADTFSQNLYKIFFGQRFFAVSYFLICAALILSVIIKRNENPESYRANYLPEVRLLAAIFIAMSLHAFLVSKQYSQRYMFPAMLLSIPGLYLSVSIISRRFFTKINPNIILAVVFFITLLFSGYTARKTIAKAKKDNIESQDLLAFVNANYPNADIILSSGTTNEYSGLILTYFYSGENVRDTYRKYINQRFPDKVWYDIFSDRIITISDSFKTTDILKSGNTILYQTTDAKYNSGLLENIKKDFSINNPRLKEVYSNSNGELLFEVVTK